MGSFDPAAGAKLASDSAALEAAAAALSTAGVEVADATSNKCGSAYLKSVIQARRARAISSKATTMMDAEQSQALLAEARHVATRSAWQK